MGRLGKVSLDGCECDKGDDKRRFLGFRGRGKTTFANTSIIEGMYNELCNSLVVVEI